MKATDFSQIDSHEVSRQVTLALVIEPLSEKEGCTTRLKDASSDATLMDFLGSAVNVSRYFYDLAERVKQASDQPEVFCDLYINALKDGKKDMRNRKFNNWGLIELLFPVVLSRLIYGGDGAAVCQNVIRILKNSSRRDAELVSEARNLAWTTSGKQYKRDYPKTVGGDNLYEQCQNNYQIATDNNYRTVAEWANQLLHGLPLIQEMYKEAKRHLSAGLIVASERSYALGRRSIDYSTGLIADYVAVVDYLLLSDPNKTGDMIF